MPTALLAEFFDELYDCESPWCELSPKDVDITLSEDEIQELFWTNWTGSKDEGFQAMDAWLAEVDERRDSEVAA